MNQIEREKIYNNFWERSYNERACFIHSRMRRCPVARRKKDSKGVRQRTNSFKYSFQASGEEKEVCQKFFLNILNFTSHRVLLTVAAKK